LGFSHFLELESSLSDFSELKKIPGMVGLVLVRALFLMCRWGLLTVFCRWPLLCALRGREGGRKRERERERDPVSLGLIRRESLRIRALLYELISFFLVADVQNHDV
jgi:hypothetical protein